MNDLQETQNTLFSALQHLAAQDWVGRGKQPWLDPVTSYRRTNTIAAQLGKRAGINGEVRSLKMSDMGTVLECEKLFAASYTGTTLQHKELIPVNQGRSGTDFHKIIEKLLPEADFQTEHTSNVSPFITIPSIGLLTNEGYAGKKKSGITGAIDAYLPNHNAGLELKSVPIGWEFPDELTPKYLGQAAGYAYGLNNYWNKHNRKPVRWFWLFLSQDMRTLNPDDPTTYRIFSKEYEELEAIFKNIYGRCYNIAQIIDQDGLEATWDSLNCYGGESCFCKN